MAIRPWSLVARRRSGRARIFLFFSASLTQPLLLCFTLGKYFCQNHRLLDQMTCFVAAPSQQRQALDQILELNNSGDCSQHPGKSEQISSLKNLLITADSFKQFQNLTWHAKALLFHRMSSRHWQVFASPSSLMISLFILSSSDWCWFRKKGNVSYRQTRFISRWKQSWLVWQESVWVWGWGGSGRELFWIENK